MLWFPLLWNFDLAAACFFKIAYLGIAICNLKSTHKDHPPQAAQTFNYSRPQIVLNTFWLVLLVVSFTSPLGFLSMSFPFMFLSCLFLSFHCPFNFLSLSFQFPFLSLSFQCPFLSFHFLQSPFLSFHFQFKSRFSRIFLEITLFGAHT